jgi:hypothetical protein
VANRLLTKDEVLHMLRPAADILDKAMAEYAKDYPGEDCWIELIPGRGLPDIRFRHGISE